MFKVGSIFLSVFKGAVSGHSSCEFCVKVTNNDCRGLSWIVFDILKSCWQTIFHFSSNFDRILFKIVC